MAAKMIDLSDDGCELSVIAEKTRFTLLGGVSALELFRLPKPGECVKMISGVNGFSSCCLVLKIAELTDIKSAIITTLRVGEKEARALANLEIPEIAISCGLIAIRTQNRYDYGEHLKDIAERCGWKLHFVNNHSKIILLDTAAGKITVETSSNFNENPKIEQFSVTNSEGVYEFFKNELLRLGVIA